MGQHEDPPVGPQAADAKAQASFRKGKVSLECANAALSHTTCHASVRAEY